VCFNAAGISGEPGKSTELTAEQMGKVLDLNAKGVWFCQRAQIRIMVRQEERALTYVHRQFPHVWYRNWILSCGSIDF
jgi:NAD(P)-dependent dehydrogenase (short-subunit alcohol dehydrogenase family)